LGADHPEVAAVLNNLAECCSASQRYAEARQLVERVLAIDESALGPEHPDIAFDLNLLGSTCEAEGNSDQAARFYERALAIREKTLGPDDPLTAKSRARLEHVLRDRSPNREATPDRFLEGPRETGNRDAVVDGPAAGAAPNSIPRTPQPSTESANGGTEPKAAAGMTPIYTEELDAAAALAPESTQARAEQCERQGQWREADRLYRDVLSSLESKNESSGLYRGAALNNLALVCAAQGKRAEAVRLLQQSLAFWLARVPQNHPCVSTTLSNLAAICSETEKKGEAAALDNWSRALRRKA
jgi:tetratricopeptide (TPR) repeat protein